MLDEAESDDDGHFAVGVTERDAGRTGSREAAIDLAVRVFRSDGAVLGAESVTVGGG